MTTRSARITGPIRYTAEDGQAHAIPLGPCLIEPVDDRLIDIIWGANGQRSAVLPVEDVESARSQGNLLLLD
jgi:hypothetical protein